MASSPLSQAYSNHTGGSPALAKRHAQNLVAHISNKSLGDDVVCKLTVPDAVSQQTPTANTDIEFKVSDLLIVLAMATHHQAAYQMVMDLRNEINRNKLSQQDLGQMCVDTITVLERTFRPDKYTAPIVAELTKAGLLTQP